MNEMQDWVIEELKDYTEHCRVYAGNGYFYMTKEAYWRLLYAEDGKRYPSPRKRKSKMRMSKKWRDSYG